MNRIEPPPPQHQRLARPALAAAGRSCRNVCSTGIAVSAGVAIGPVFGTTEPDAVITQQKIQASDIGAEGARLEAAIVQSRKQLTKLRARLAVLPEESQAEIAPLIDAYIRMLGPSRLVRGVRRRIEETLQSAEAAVTAEATAIADAIMAQAEPNLSAEDLAGLRRRADEIREIARRLVRNLTRSPFRSFAGLPEGSILVAEALRPADAALLDPARLAGVVTEEGGADGHTAVMLRALGRAGRAGGGGSGACDAAGRRRRGGWNRRDGDSEPVGRDDGIGAPGGDGVRAGAAALCQAAAPAGRHAGRRGGGVAGQPGTADRAAADRAVRRGGNWSAADRVPVHESGDHSGRGDPDRKLPDDRRGDAWRSRHHPRAGLGRREGDRGADAGRHRAGDRRHQPGPRACAGSGCCCAGRNCWRCSFRGDSASLDGRDGAGVAADGHDRRRGAGRSGAFTNGWRGGCGGGANGSRRSCRRWAS